MSDKKLEYLPNHLKGKVYFSKTNGTYSRHWNESEIKWLKYLIKKGYTNKEIAESMDRSVSSVAIKRKRLNKDIKHYNKTHLIDKVKINKEFLRFIEPKTVLDLYNGGSSLYDNFDVTTNDINTEFDTDYHKDAFKLLCELYSQDKEYDLIDIDPFGSAYDCFDLAIKMANKGLCITFGELNHKRWRRMDYVKRVYNIRNYDDFTLDNLISNVQRIGLRNKKKLKIYSKREWLWIGRVWFVVEPLKINYSNHMQNSKKF